MTDKPLSAVDLSVLRAVRELRAVHHCATGRGVAQLLGTNHTRVMYRVTGSGLLAATPNLAGSVRPSSARLPTETVDIPGGMVRAYYTPDGELLHANVVGWHLPR